MDADSADQGPRQLTHEQAVEAVRELTAPGFDAGPGPRPFVLVEGGRGYGKTAFLDRLEREAGEVVPCARADLGADSTRQFAQILSDLAGGLAHHHRRYGRLRFPRLLTGQIVAGLEDLDPARFDRLDRMIRERLREERNVPTRRDSVPPSDPSMTIPLSPFTVTIPVSLLTSIGRRARPIGWGVRWYGDQDRGLRKRPGDVLGDLYRKALKARNEQGEEARRAQDDVNALLCAAFLADLRHARRRVRTRLHTPLLLLDNAHTPSGRAVLRELLDARHQLIRQGAGVPLTVVLTCGPNSLPELDRERSGALSDVVRERPAAGAAVSPWGREGMPRVLRNRPPELKQSEIDDLHRGADGRGDWRLVQLIHTFSGGHPETGRLLCGIAAAGDGEGPSVAELLTARLPDPPDARHDVTAEQLLLERLMPFERDVLDRAMEALAPLAAARTREERYWVVGRAEFVDPEWREQLRAAAGWDFEGDAGLRVLRQLLLGTLAARPSGDPKGWDAVHGELAHRGRLHEDHAAALHHELALDRLGPVARELAEALGRRDAREWLDTLAVVAEAPCGCPRRREKKPYERYEELLRVLEGEDWWMRDEDPSAAHAAKLVAALRVVSDPLTGMDRRYLYDQMAGALTALAEVSRNGMVALNEEADVCRTKAELWAAR